MKTRAAVLWDREKDWSVEEIDLDPPKSGEALVKIVGSGLCHSDEHIRSGDLPWPLPIIGGHEGAGVIEEVGPDVKGLTPGDHVVFSFTPACGRCSCCSRGMQNLCELGMYMAEGYQLSDGTSRHHARGDVDLRTLLLLGAFAEHTVVNEANLVKIDGDIPLDIACLVGCGVVTGWGSMVTTGELRAGDTAVVVGVGGIGINAVQGAAAAGAEFIVAVDPVPFKREQARAFGATHAVSTSEEATNLLQDLTKGRMADVVVNTVGLGTGRQVGLSLAMAGKRGRVVVTNLHNAMENDVSLNAIDLVLYEKQLRGSLYGSGNPRVDIPRFLDLYRHDKIKLDDLVTKRYSLDEINDGYRDLLEGKVLRAVMSL
ncbi:NDMA-dependent alcohol dehydrogenase [Mycobacterium intracellulare]|uniref:alcohol dehydrogenase n=1 Tax=Mycobacterium intracellulare subsp. chimaera TaxID=222805 RepID=A0ABT7P2Z0_MYCIT|nr:NDMA-dependent alcohol dehydrogenase [Mycobacterium intracellulare]MDM3927491.1 NDMA-dependent alcohol dehydrogenase [Mycobacterium intracellulare subsp. chimaera]